jgi:hypothetical protein
MHERLTGRDAIVNDAKGPFVGSHDERPDNGPQSEARMKRPLRPCFRK